MAADAKKMVLLLKSPGKDGKDSYVEALEAANFEACCTPVLTFEFTNIDKISSSLCSPDEYFGLVVTSPRAVESLLMATRTIASDWEKELCSKWKTKPVFVVGEATGRDIMQLGLVPLGEESGNAEALAEVILNTEGVKSSNKRLLFPVSSLGRDVLPSRLAEGGVTLDKITTYQTVPDPDMQKNLNHIISAKAPEYIVFFSPSGVVFSWDLWRDLGVDPKTIKCVAIGPTTQKALQDKDIAPIVAQKPTPENLVSAILEYS